MDGWNDGCIMDGWVIGWINRMDGRKIDGWMDERKSGQTNK